MSTRNYAKVYIDTMRGIIMGIADLFKKPSSKDIFGYQDYQDEFETENNSIPALKPQKAQRNKPSEPIKNKQSRDIELESLILEWECFKLKMDAYLRRR